LGGEKGATVKHNTRIHSLVAYTRALGLIVQNWVVVGASGTRATPFRCAAPSPHGVHSPAGTSRPHRPSLGHEVLWVLATNDKHWVRGFRSADDADCGHCGVSMWNGCRHVPLWECPHEQWMIAWARMCARTQKSNLPPYPPALCHAAGHASG
jgi:hypothetical protein